MKYFLIFFITIFFFSSAVTGACEAGFLNGAIDKQALKAELIDVGKPRQKYTGQEGYLKIADTYFKGNMRGAFETISSLLSSVLFKKLGWQYFKGTTSEFKELKNQILDEAGELKKEYIGQETGYLQFADTYYGGEMKKAFENASSVLSSVLFKKLGWQAFFGTTSEFKELKNQILDEAGELKKEYIGQETGYLQFADTYYGGEMQKAFINVSSVLSSVLFKKLGWQQFKGTTSEFKELKNQILDEAGELKEEYIGQETGYLQFADTYYGGEMKKAFENASSVLSSVLFKKLGWQQFKGTTSEFKELKNQILDEAGELKEEYIGQETGYLQFADTYYGGEMKKAFMNASSVLSSVLFKKLGWQKFIGTTSEFKELKNQILDEVGELKEEYIGQETGYLQFADTYYGGEMQKAFENASSVLSSVLFKKLRWQAFFGTTSEFKELKNQILDEAGELKKEYIGQETGYSQFADTYYGGEMQKAFENASSVLSKVLFKKLGWQNFKGTTSEFKELKNQILDEAGELKKEYIGQETGYLQFADTYYGGEMKKAFENASSVLSSVLFKKLGWQQFKGTTSEFKELKNQILDEAGELKEEYIGQETGYLQFADTYYGGEMTRAFVNASSVLSKVLFQQLGWKQFQGSTDQFHALIMYFRTHQFEDYKGEQGQRQIAALIFKNNFRRAYMNVSTLREYLFINKDVFKDLRESGWSITLR